MIPGFKTPVLLKRSCFMCEETLKATLSDGVKVISNLFRKPSNKYGVIYEDGSLKKGWWDMTYTKILRTLVKLMVRMARHCDGSGTVGGTGHCY